MAKPDVCSICDKSINRVRTPQGLPRFAWKSEFGFYCGQSHDGWHHPTNQSKQGSLNPSKCLSAQELAQRLYFRG